MTKNEAATISPNWSMTPRWPPDRKDVCDRCGEGWHLNNAHDHDKHDHDKHLSLVVIRHRGCQRLAVVDETRAFLMEVLDEVGFPNVDVRMIPSQYHTDDLAFGPWFKIETSKGVLTYGRRKRVWNLDWKDARQIDLHGRDIVEDEAYTHGDWGAHLYSREGLVKAFKKIKDAVV